MTLAGGEKTRSARGQGAEKAFLQRYKPGTWPRPSVTADLVVLTIVDALLRVLLVRRSEHPFKDAWALPGGFVRVGEGQKDQGEDLDAAAARELQEETGLDPRQVYLEQLYTFGQAGRDPRTRVITVAYYALVRPDLAPLVRAGGDAARVQWFDVSSLGKVPLAFDHQAIIAKALERIRGKLDYSDLAFNLVPQTFTIPELRSVHQIVTGAPQDPGNFRRRFNRMLDDGLIAKAPGKRITASKPATVYRFVRKSEPS
ncbi:MAG: NUDIX hydrolase [Myxococcaceae bacterium]